MQRRTSPNARWHWYWLLLLPYIFLLWVPSYNSIPPAIAGIPFFYWYQFAWIGITAAIIWFVYVLARHRADR